MYHHEAAWRSSLLPPAGLFNRTSGLELVNADGDPRRTTLPPACSIWKRTDSGKTLIGKFLLLFKKEFPHNKLKIGLNVREE
ncbi:hypothetical cytosolic protein [Syntrophus aciditrophicus SB]|uniref:Hypothetical cytosolic protein n=1 Tax=Syntrophus aciditrophicus (strain SB) TaxID=56780 RepID=Q2LXJ2_SYNAS|nr:hypothetical cytosolic protein [Syntrophus aciditrophicus SB]